MNLTVSAEKIEVDVEVTDDPPKKPAKPAPRTKRRPKQEPIPLVDYDLDGLLALEPGEILDRLLEAQRNGYAKPFPTDWSTNDEHVGEHLAALKKMWRWPRVYVEDNGMWCVRPKYGGSLSVKSNSLPHASALARLIACWQRLKSNGGGDGQAH